MSTMQRQARTAEEIVVVHSDYSGLMKLTVALGEMRYRVTSAESKTALRTARRMTAIDPAAMIIALDGTENVAEIRELLAMSGRTKFVFLADAMPPHAALARVVNGHGSTIISRDEAPVVIVSTLVALLASYDDRAV